MEQLLFELAALGLDVLIMGVCYKIYRIKKQCAQAVKDAPVMEIDSQLSQQVINNGNIVPYAVVSGVVKAASTPLRSQYLPHVSGVLREKITKERKVRWSAMLRLWSTVEEDIQRSYNSIPFVLTKNNGWLKSSSVHIDIPTSAEELALPTVYDHFVSHQDSIGEAVMGWFQGERSLGVQEIENMLTEGTTLTGVGELVVESGKVKLQPPSSGLCYYLTSLPIDTLIKKLEMDAKVFKTLSIVMGCMGVVLLACVLKSLYNARKRKLELIQRNKQFQEARRLRRAQDPSQNDPIQGNTTTPLCVICMSNPVGVVILECGHTCLCLDCSEQITRTCPVCRSHIERFVPAFLP